MKLFAAILIFCLACFIRPENLYANSLAPVKIIVSKKGKADFRSIQGAINSLSQNAEVPRIIFIKKGIYKEKIYLEKNNVILQGEDMQQTVITQAIARDEWRCMHNEDWGVATLNVDGNDITLTNLTIINSYGYDNKIARTVYCAADTAKNHKKIISATGHQMAMRTMNTTRLKALHCTFKAFAGDTVSPWNVTDGLFYFKDCIMEGGVDFYCPRGWSYAENCSFFANTGEASVWHDGSANKDSKSVMVNCSFDGYDGFKLGRYHRDAQFYFVGCNFSERMADKAVYLVPTTNNIQWGDRVYYANCHRKTGDYTWFADNFKTIDLDSKDVNPSWVFGDKWNPLINN